jgi:hypothetical protein
MAKGASESITSLNIRVCDPSQLPASCPVCNCLFGPNEERIMAGRAVCGVWGEISRAVLLCGVPRRRRREDNMNRARFTCLG